MPNPEKPFFTLNRISSYQLRLYIKGDSHFSIGCLVCLRLEPHHSYCGDTCRKLAANGALWKSEYR